MKTRFGADAAAVAPRLLLQRLRQTARLQIRRPLGGAIPWTALDAYARRYGIAGLDFEDFSYLIRALDDEWLKVMAEKRKAEEARGRKRS